MPSKASRRPWYILMAVAAALGLASCSAPHAPPAAPSAPAPSARATTPSPAPAARHSDALSEADWRRALAQHILTVNRDRVFEGRPPHPLKAVVVLDLSVGADGRIHSASVMRAPKHAPELGAVAVRTAQAASPLPPPPRALLGRSSSVRFTETWLFRQDERFQLRTLAQNQLIQ
jgi:periplasmic protein TonB